MTATRRALLVCAGALMVAGVAVSAAAFALAGGDLDNLSNERRDWRQETHEVSAAELADVTAIVASDSETVRIEGYDGDGVVVECWVNDDREVSVSRRAETLEVTSAESPAEGAGFHVGSTVARDTVIYVPTSFEGDVSARSTGGAAAVVGLANLGEVDASALSGQATLNAVAARGATVESGNGCVRADLVNVEGALVAESSNGTVSVSEVVADEVRATSSNGDVTVSSCTARSSIEASTGNGTAVLWRTDAPTTEATSLNGSIEVHLPGVEDDYFVDASSQNGRCTAPRGARDAAREVVARNQNGSVLVDLEGSDLGHEGTLYYGGKLGPALESLG